LDFLISGPSARDVEDPAAVEKLQSSLASQHTSDATSSTLTKRFIGILDSM
jgi:hypothetical protein